MFTGKGKNKDIAWKEGEKRNEELNHRKKGDLSMGSY